MKSRRLVWTRDESTDVDTSPNIAFPRVCVSASYSGMESGHGSTGWFTLIQSAVHFIRLPLSSPLSLSLAEDERQLGAVGALSGRFPVAVRLVLRGKIRVQLLKPTSLRDFHTLLYVLDMWVYCQTSKKWNGLKTLCFEVQQMRILQTNGNFSKIKPKGFYWAWFYHFVS